MCVGSWHSLALANSHTLSLGEIESEGVCVINVARVIRIVSISAIASQQRTESLLKFEYI